MINCIVKLFICNEVFNTLYNLQVAIDYLSLFYLCVFQIMTWVARHCKLDWKHGSETPSINEAAGEVFWAAKSAQFSTNITSNDFVSVMFDHSTVCIRFITIWTLRVCLSVDLVLSPEVIEGLCRLYTNLLTSCFCNICLKFCGLLFDLCNVMYWFVSRMQLWHDIECA